MLVRVKLYATLPRYVDGARAGVPIELELLDDASVADMVGQLELPPEEVKIVFVNGHVRPTDWALAAGDVVGIFPPIGGG